MYIVLAFDHPEGSINDIVRVLLKFLLCEILQLLSDHLRKLLLSQVLALQAEREFGLSSGPRAASDLEISFFVLLMDIESEL